ncbi:hypothetical protein [Streptomyces lavendulae]|uniref:hypothetical protein n=1 Tax=Streptomyces lavendulae TaxID=1914 RepID=UPI0031F0DD59
MGYRLRRWFEDRLPQEITSGERVVAVTIADLVWDDTRLGYGRKFMDKLLHRSGFENEAQLGKVLGKLAARGVELRVPITGQDGEPLKNNRGQLVYAHRGRQRTFRVPLETEFPARTVPDWDDDEEWSPSRETIPDERSPQGETFRGERSPCGVSMATPQGGPIPLTPSPSIPPSGGPRPAATPEGAGRQQEDPDIAAAVAFLQELSEPWAVGRVTAKAYAPTLLEVIAEKGWHLDEQLAVELTKNPNGINSYRSVLRSRIEDLPRAPQRAAAQAASSLPAWCGECGDGNPAAEFNAKWRTVPGSSKPCLNCHPTAQTADAA